MKRSIYEARSSILIGIIVCGQNRKISQLISARLLSIEKIRAFLENDDQGKSEKLLILAERLEFIEALGVVQNEIFKHHIFEEDYTPIIENGKTRGFSKIVNFVCNWLNHDFAGVHFDIEGLRIYLLATCIDTIMGQPDHKDAFQWLKERDRLPLKEELGELSQEFKEQYGTSYLFRNAFTHCIDNDLKFRWCESFMCVAIEGRNGDRPARLRTESLRIWQAKSVDEKMKAISVCIYGARSRFTHCAIRSFCCDTPIESLEEGRVNNLVRYGPEDQIALLLATIHFLVLNRLIGN